MPNKLVLNDFINLKVIFIRYSLSGLSNVPVFFTQYYSTFQVIKNVLYVLPKLTRDGISKICLVIGAFS